MINLPSALKGHPLYWEGGEGRGGGQIASLQNAKHTQVIYHTRFNCILASKQMANIIVDIAARERKRERDAENVCVCVCGLDGQGLRLLS